MVHFKSNSGGEGCDDYTEDTALQILFAIVELLSSCDDYYYF